MPIGASGLVGIDNTVRPTFRSRLTDGTVRISNGGGGGTVGARTNLYGQSISATYTDWAATYQYDVCHSSIDMPARQDGYMIYIQCSRCGRCGYLNIGHETIVVSKNNFICDQCFKGLKLDTPKPHEIRDDQSSSSGMKAEPTV